MAYQAAMKAEQERLAKAQKRNFEMASGSVGGSDVVAHNGPNTWLGLDWKVNADFAKETAGGGGEAARARGPEEQIAITQLS